MQIKRATLAAFLAILSTPLTLVGQSILTVDSSGGAQHLDIQAAVDAAAAGDVVLVYAGDYSEFSITGKGIDLVADEGAVVRIVATEGSMRTLISGVPSGQRALVRGLQFAPPNITDDNVLYVENSPGLVVIEEFSIDWPPPLPFSHWQLVSGHAVEVADCDNVVLVDSDIVGAFSSYPGGLRSGQIGLGLSNSSVMAHGCTILAGGTTVIRGTGQTALHVNGGQLVLRKCVLEAAGGGHSAGGTGGNGGPGLTLTGGATVHSIGSQLIGGAPGTATLGTPGAMGPAFLNQGGTLNQTIAAEAQLIANRVVREGAIAQLTLESEPNAFTWLLLEPEMQIVFVPELNGFLGVGPTPLVLPAGMSDATGSMQLAVTTPILPVGLPLLRVTTQMLLWTPSLQFEMTNPTTVTIVDGVY